MGRIIKIIGSAIIKTITSMSTIYAIVSPIVEEEFCMSLYAVLKSRIWAQVVFFTILVICFIIALQHSRYKYPSRVLKGTENQNGYGRYYFTNAPDLVRDSLIEIYKRSSKYGVTPFALASVDAPSEINKHVMILRHLAYYDSVTQEYSRKQEFKDIPTGDIKLYRYRHSISVNLSLNNAQGGLVQNEVAGLS